MQCLTTHTWVVYGFKFVVEMFITKSEPLLLKIENNLTPSRKDQISQVPMLSPL